MNESQKLGIGVAKLLRRENVLTFGRCAMRGILMTETSRKKLRI
jgi:hypothetical protein